MMSASGGTSVVASPFVYSAITIVSVIGGALYLFRRWIFAAHRRWILLNFPWKWNLTLVDIYHRPSQSLLLYSSSSASSSSSSVGTPKNVDDAKDGSATEGEEEVVAPDRFRMEDDISGLSRENEGNYTEPFFFVQCADTQVGISSTFPWLRRPRDAPPSSSPPSSPPSSSSSSTTTTTTTSTSSPSSSSSSSKTSEAKRETEQNIADSLAWEWDLINMERLVHAVNAMRPAPRFLCVCGDLSHFLPGSPSTVYSRRQRFYCDS